MSITQSVTPTVSYQAYRAEHLLDLFGQDFTAFTSLFVGVPMCEFCGAPAQNAWRIPELTPGDPKYDPIEASIHRECDAILFTCNTCEEM